MSTYVVEFKRNICLAVKKKKKKRNICLELFVFLFFLNVCMSISFITPKVDRSN